MDLVSKDEFEGFTCRCGCGEIVKDEGDFTPECAAGQADYLLGDDMRKGAIEDRLVAS